VLFRSKPRVIKSCTGCGICFNACKSSAMELGDKITINYEKCFGCGLCVSLCPNNALKPKHKNLRKLFAESAAAVIKNFKRNKQFFVNVLMDISYTCDCHPIANLEPISNDIGIVVSNNIMAVDTSSIDLIEKNSKNIFHHLYSIDPYEIIKFSEDCNIGSRNYIIKKI
jgi:uncharacterized Fe-S center protein